MQNERIKEISKMVQLLAINEFNPKKAEDAVRRHHPWMLTRSAVGASDHANLAGTFHDTIGGTFLLSLEHGPSCFDQVRPYSRKAPFHTPLFIGNALTAAVVGEGVSIPTVKYAVTNEGLTPTKVAGVAVATVEALRSEEGAQSLTEELREGVALATDSKFFTDLTSDAGATDAAVGDPVDDIATLLSSVNLSGSGRLYLFAGPARGNELALHRGGGSTPVFPQMGPKGGVIQGITVLISAALSDTVILLDPSAVTTGSSDMEIKTSQNATIEMESDPSGNSETPAALTGHPVNMFQTDSVAVIGIRSFASKLMRTSGCAVLTGVGWTEASS